MEASTPSPRAPLPPIFNLVSTLFPRPSALQGRHIMRIRCWAQHLARMRNPHGRVCYEIPRMARFGRANVGVAEYLEMRFVPHLHTYVLNGVYLRFFKIRSPNCESETGVTDVFLASTRVACPTGPVSFVSPRCVPVVLPLCL